MHLHSLVGVSTLVNYNERHVDKVIWELWRGGGGAGGLFSFQRPAQVQEVGGHAPEDQKQIRTSSTWINHPVSVQMKLINTAYHLLVKNNKGKGRDAC